MSKTNKILDEEFNTISPEELAMSSDIQSALRLINQEHIISDLQPKPERNVKKELTTIKGKEPTKALQSINDTMNQSIAELMCEPELDTISELSEFAFTELINMALNTSNPNATSALAGVAEKFLSTKMKAASTKAENRLKRLKLEIEKANQENKKSEEDSIELGSDGGLGSITIVS